MSRWEFMRQLEQLLMDISPNEREAALQYYNDYFNDAGIENEQEVVEALGSPEQVAQIVKDGLAENGAAGGFTENGFTDSPGNVQNELIQGTQAADNRAEESGSADGTQKEDKKELPTWAIVLLVIAAVLFSPVWISLLAVAVGLVISVFAGVFSLIVGLAAATVALYAAAIGLIIAGFGCIISHTIVGIGLIGGGLLSGALGVLLMLLLVLLLGGVPALFSGIAYIWNSIFKKKGGTAA